MGRRRTDGGRQVTSSIRPTIATSLDVTARGTLERTLPVYIGRRATNYGRVTSAQWRELRRGSAQEFLVNEAVADLADARVVGELNRFRGRADLVDTLGDLLKDARKRVNEIDKEYLAPMLTAGQHEPDGAGKPLPHPPGADAHDLPTTSKAPPSIQPLSPRRGGPVRAAGPSGRRHGQQDTVPPMQGRGHKARECRKKAQELRQ